MSGRPFRFYISSALVLMALFVSITVCAVLLVTLQSELEEEIADRLVNTAKLGVKTLDLDAYQRLTQKLANRTLSDAELAAIEASDDFHSISASLNDLRAMKPDLFLYVYTLFPTADPQRAKFVADADVLSLRREVATTGKASSEITPFNMDYDLRDQPVTVQALASRRPAIEPAFVYDYSEKVYSMMGFAPIVARDGTFLGVLGIDASNGKVGAYLIRLFFVALVLTLVLVVAILAAAVGLAHRLSRPILELTASVRRISGQDWDVRVDTKSKIREIYDLKAHFNEMADRIGDYQTSLLRTNESLTRFVPFEFLDFLDRKAITEVQLGDQTQRDMAVLFLQIRDFSAVTATMSPKQTFSFVNTYLNRLAPIVRRHHGFIDKYLGDGIMALFPGEGDDAVAAALDLQRELAALNQERDAQRLPPLEAGIGVHAGVMMLGTIGEAQRVQGTVISEAVSVAMRLEALARGFGVSTLMSKDLFDRLRQPDTLEIRFVGWAQEPAETLPLMELYGAEPADQGAKKGRSKPEFERGVRLLHEGQRAAARVVFEAILKENPRDRPALRLADQCQTR